MYRTVRTHSQKLLVIPCFSVDRPAAGGGDVHPVYVLIRNVVLTGMDRPASGVGDVHPQFVHILLLPACRNHHRHVSLHLCGGAQCAQANTRQLSTTDESEKVI